MYNETIIIYNIYGYYFAPGDRFYIQDTFYIKHDIRQGRIWGANFQKIIEIDREIEIEKKLINL
jgi:hypothetical protein